MVSNQAFTYTTGAIHGRFQPFHLGHMAYLLQAAQLALDIVIGITNPYHETAQEQTDRNRHSPENNPFDLAERAEMIKRSIASMYVLRDRRIEIVPFDITTDKCGTTWDSVIASSTVQIVTPNEAWDREKARRFEAAGYRVHLLPTNQEVRITATQVRKLWRERDPRWRTLVPEGTLHVMDALAKDPK